MYEKKALKEYVVIANIHADRMKESSDRVAELFPLDGEIFKILSLEKVAFLDLMTTRFGKLQDLVGAKIFPLILNLLEEDAPSFIDKLNRLEKLGYLEKASWWVKLREMRNQLAHDYSRSEKIVASHLNQILPFVGQLASFWDGLKEKIDHLIETT